MVGKCTSHYLMIDGKHCHFPKNPLPEQERAEIDEVRIFSFSQR